MRVTYLVFDLDDAAVRRRAELLAATGVDVRVAGFRRRAAAPTTVARSSGPPFDLGRTRDGRLLARAATVAGIALRPGALRVFAAGTDVLLCRNLETLLLGIRIRRPGQRLVFECLDIHRAMLGAGRGSRAMRALERWALSRVDGLLTSSPDFVEQYFSPVQRFHGETLVAENKVPSSDDEPDRPPASAPHRPITIGWFGRLRCARSLAELSEIARRSDGAVEVLMAGTPSDDVFPDFADQVAGRPGVTYLGSYGPEDLPGLYARCDVAWAIDYFEEGLNSAWLLPNRLYEGLANGAVPLALRDVATGRWLAAHDVGLLVDDARQDVLPLLTGLSDETYTEHSLAVASVADDAVFQLPGERRVIVDFLTGGTSSGTARVS